MSAAHPRQSINGDMRRRAVMHAAAMSWQPSPSGTVWRKRLHLVGPPEAGQVTSLVRYERGARFPAHDHPGGEEILVLEGTFSDQRGDWPAGAYLLNPEGFRHAPFSREGCMLFVKLRQYPGRHRQHLALDTTAMEWEPGPLPGVQVKYLYADPRVPETMRLEQWSPGTQPGTRSYPGGAELLVLEGAFEDEALCCEKGTWLRLPPGGRHAPLTRDGCVLYVKSDGVAALRSVPEPGAVPRFGALE